MYDGREELTFSGLQNDVFVGARLAFNNRQDSQVLAGSILDAKHGTALFSIEASQRIKESWKTENEEFLYFIRRDSFVKFSINKYSKLDTTLCFS